MKDKPRRSRHRNRRRRPPAPRRPAPPWRSLPPLTRFLAGVCKRYARPGGGGPHLIHAPGPGKRAERWCGWLKPQPAAGELRW